MKSRQIDHSLKTFILVFETGDELAKGRLEFAEQEKLSAAGFKAVGALSLVHLGWFSCESKQYEPSAVHAEMVTGFPSGRLFLDSVEQAMAVALVSGHAVKHRPVQTSRGGLGPARLRRIIEFVHSKMEDELGLNEMAQSVGLSTAHFARMFRKSTGETPHQFVLRQRLERARAMLRAPAARVLDVAVACGFKTQQHFAQVFRDVSGISPTRYRQDFLG